VKLPYRLGDSFALPLGNGQFARSCIVHCEHRVVIVRVTTGEASWLDLRVSDDALVMHRWRHDGRVDLRGAAEPQPQNRYWMHSARAERIAAGALGAPHPRERKIRVRELRDDNAAAALAEVDDDCILTLTESISNETLDHISAAIFNHPGLTIRLTGEAVAHLGALAKTPITRLSLSEPVDHFPPIETMLHLDLADAGALASADSAFPNLASLRVSQRAAALQIRELSALRKLRWLDLSLIHVVDETEFAHLRELRSLRLNRITGMRSADALAPVELNTLALEDMHELERVDGLARIASLEQLELLGLWQFEIDDVTWTLNSERLTRAEIDIGGRRKNIELYRRAQWAYPWRF